MDSGEYSPEQKWTLATTRQSKMDSGDYSPEVIFALGSRCFIIICYYLLFHIYSPDQMWNSTSDPQSRSTSGPQTQT